MEKKLVYQALENLDSNFFDDTVTSVLKELSFLKEKYEDQGFLDIRVQADADRDGLYGYSVSASRYETDEECAKRLAKAEKNRLSAELRKKKKQATQKELEKDKEYKEFLKLKKKFEG